MNYGYASDRGSELLHNMFYNVVWISKCKPPTSPLTGCAGNAPTDVYCDRKPADYFVDDYICLTTGTGFRNGPPSRAQGWGCINENFVKFAHMYHSLDSENLNGSPVPVVRNGLILLYKYKQNIRSFNLLKFWDKIVCKKVHN